MKRAESIPPFFLDIPSDHREEEIQISRTDITTRSRKRAIAADLNAIMEYLQPPPGHRSYRMALGTVTYASENDWDPKDITALGQCYERWCQRRGFPFVCVWVAELHDSGKVHYHYIFWVPVGITPPKPDKRGWWKKGSSRVEWVKRNPFYICKYIQKSGPAMPDHYRRMRTHGVRGVGSRSSDIARWRRLYRAPKWLRPYLSPDSDLRRDGAFWIDPVRGHWWLSPWRFVRLGVGALVFEKGVMQRGLISQEGSYIDWDGGRRDYYAAKGLPVPE